MKPLNMISRITAVLLITAVCSAAVEVTVAWDPSSTDIGGNPLNETPTYKLFYGEASGVYTQNVNVGNATLIKVAGLKYDTIYFFAAKAYTETTESSYSEELQWESPVLTALTIAGAATVNEGATAQYTCTAAYSDGSTQTVTPVWSENSSFASISTNGLLSASSVSADQSVTLTAAYGGLSDTHAVTVKDVPPGLTGLTIAGAATVNEGATAQYTCTAAYSDGSTQTVTPVWSETSSFASINSSGLLSASSVSADQSVTLTAAYGGLSDTHSVTIKVLPPKAPTNIHPSDQAMNVERIVTLEWNEVANASGYEVWCGDSPETMSKVSVQSAPSYYTGLRRAGQTFWWQIVATNETGSATGGPWSFTTIDEETTEEVLGTVNQDWDTSGTAPWFAQTNITHGGISSMQSGAIAAGQASVVETTVVGPGTISFWWRVSSEASGDFLNFYTNGTLKTGISGIAESGNGWIRESFSVGRGTQRLAWKYEKNGSGTGGNDAGWLDDVQWQSENIVTFPLSGFTGKWAAFYLWDQTDQIWIPLGQEFQPDELVISNIKPERWYWLSVMEYDAVTKIWSPVHGSWINHWDEI